MILGLSTWIIAPIMQVVWIGTQQKMINGYCEFVALSGVWRIIVGLLLFLWEYLFPCLIMAFCFTRICARLMQQRNKVSNSSRRVESISYPNSSQQMGREATINEASGRDNFVTECKRNRNITKTFVIIFAGYLVCWSLNQFLFLQYSLGGYYHWGSPENHVSVVMAILNTACNPFIYVLHMKQYREKLKAFCWCHHWVISCRKSS